MHIDLCWDGEGMFSRPKLVLSMTLIEITGSINLKKKICNSFTPTHVSSLPIQTIDNIHDN